MKQRRKKIGKLSAVRLVTSKLFWFYRHTLVDNTHFTSTAIRAAPLLVISFQESARSACTKILDKQRCNPSLNKWLGTYCGKTKEKQKRKTNKQTTALVVRKARIQREERMVVLVSERAFHQAQGTGARFFVNTLPHGRIVRVMYSLRVVKLAYSSA